jgi:hypothetical protein
MGHGFQALSESDGAAALHGGGGGALDPDQRLRPVIRPAVAADFAKFIDGPYPYRVRAITGLIGDEVVALGGIAYLPDDTHGVFLFADDKARGYPVALHKTAVGILLAAKQLGIRTLVATADPSIPAAERWLRRLGFTQHLINNQRVWLCSFSR